MISLDTNLLIYARVEANPWHEPARAFLQSLAENPDVVIAELVLVEFYLALRNPAIMATPLSAAEAVAECQWFRAHPRWALAAHHRRATGPHATGSRGHGICHGQPPGFSRSGFLKSLESIDPRLRQS